MRGWCVQYKAVAAQGDAEAIVARAVAAGIDTIFYNVPLTYAANGTFDRLGTLIAVAHAAGVRVGAWLCPGVDPYIVAHWATPEGDFANFGYETCRTVMATLVGKIVKTYAVDCVVLDYMRHRHLIDEGKQYYTADEVTETVRGIHNVIGDVPMMAFVKAYKRDWTRWAQDYMTWLEEELIEAAFLMTYKPTTSSYDYHMDAILDELDGRGIGGDAVMPCLSVLANEVLKAASLVEAELKFFKDGYGRTDVVIFDDRASDVQLALLTKVLGEPEEIEIPVETVDLSGEIAMLREMLGDVTTLLDAAEAQLGTWIQQVRTDVAEMEKRVDVIEGKMS